MSEVEAAGVPAEKEGLPPLLKNVQEMLNEEKWTRATLNNYSTGHFKDLDAVLKESWERRLDDALKSLCDDHLIHTKNSIIALYISGRIALSRQLIDDSAMVNLVTIFVDNHKWNIVKYLCDGILEFGESKFALRTMADCYKNENNEEGLYETWERLVKVDYEEADLAKALAEHYEKLGNTENAIDYYKKALHRYIAKSLFGNIKEIWEKLLQYCPEDIDFFLHVQKRIAKNLSDDKAVILLRDVCDLCTMRDDAAAAITVLKIILDYDEDDRQARKDITDAYKNLYANHSQLEECIRVSNLTQSYRNVHEAIADFEKHIAFDKGNYVSHRQWGVGRIIAMEGDDIRIDFVKKRGHTMSLKMAINALQTLPKEHIKVLKATWKKEKLYEKVLGDIEWALKIVIRSYGNSCDIKQIKAELSPSVLTEKEWTSWSAKAREILKSNSSFGANPERIDFYSVRDRPISMEEKLYNRFKAEREFPKRAQIIRSYALLKDAEFDSEFFNEMFSYFLGCLKTYNQVNEEVMASFLLIKDLVSKHPQMGAGFSLNFMEIFSRVEDPCGLFLVMKKTLKEKFFLDEYLRHIELFVPGWVDIFIKIFPLCPVDFIINSFQRAGMEEKFTGLVRDCFSNYRDCREAVLYFFKESHETDWFKEAGISREKQLITLIYILNATYRDIDNKRDAAENRKINKQVYTILFKDGTINDFIDNADIDTITRIFSFINDVKDLDPEDKMFLKNRIQEKYPDFKVFGEEEKKTVILGLIVTKEKYDENQKLYERIINVDMPANEKELEDARRLGDLRENAEYTEALAQQKRLQKEAATLGEELERAQIFDPSTVNTNQVSFATKVSLVDKESGENLEYTILGPWETDPDNGIISYQTPIGKAMFGKTVGEDVDLSLHGKTVRYRIESIVAAL
jgi:transcription elongation factor GreA